MSTSSALVATLQLLHLMNPCALFTSSSLVATLQLLHLMNPCALFTSSALVATLQLLHFRFQTVCVKEGEILNLKIFSGGIRPRVPWRASPALYGLSHQPSRIQRCEKSTAFGGMDICVYQPVNVSCIPLLSSSICD